MQSAELRQYEEPLQFADAGVWRQKLFYRERVERDAGCGFAIHTSEQQLTVRQVVAAGEGGDLFVIRDQTDVGRAEDLVQVDGVLAEERADGVEVGGGFGVADCDLGADCGYSDRPLRKNVAVFPSGKSRT